MNHTTITVTRASEDNGSSHVTITIVHPPEASVGLLSRLLDSANAEVETLIGVE